MTSQQAIYRYRPRRLEVCNVGERGTWPAGEGNQQGVYDRARRRESGYGSIFKLSSPHLCSLEFGVSTSSVASMGRSDAGLLQGPGNLRERSRPGRERAA